VSEEICRLVDGYVAMGLTGMAEHAEHAAMGHMAV
jgi:hypothetical protein